MKERCDRCKRRKGRYRVDGDWRLFCRWCFFAGAWEPAQPRKSR